MLPSTRSSAAPDWRMVVENIDGAILVLDLAGTVVLANDAVQRYTRTPVEHLAGACLWNLPEVRPHAERIQMLFDDALGGTDIDPLPLPLVDTDGRPRTVLWHSRFLRDGHGTPTHVLLTGSDITRQHAAETALREREQHYRFALKSANATSWEIDLPSGRGTWSEEAASLYGVDLHDRHTSIDIWRNMLHPDDRVADAAYFERMIAERWTAFDTENRILHPTRGVRWISTRGTVTYAPDGTPLRMIGIDADITERKNAQQALEESEREQRALNEHAERERSRLAAVLEVMPASVFLADASGRLVATNPAAQELWGGRTPLVERDEFTTYEAWHPDGRPFGPDDWGLARALDGGIVTDQRARIRTFDGHTKSILNYARPITDADGNRLGAVAVSIDVTRLEEADAFLRRHELERALGEGLAAERRRLGRELHDGIRQQLVGIQMLSSSLHKRLAAAGIPEATLMEEFTKLVANTNLQVRELISGLVPVKVPAEHLFPALQRSTANIEQWYGIPCRATTTGTPAPMDDETADHLFHIAQEAITNAARHARPTLITAHLQHQPGRLELTVHDDGGGLPEGYASRGGIGIQNIRNRTEIIGGTLTLHSSEGAGTTVTVELSLPDRAERETLHAND